MSEFADISSMIGPRRRPVAPSSLRQNEDADQDDTAADEELDATSEDENQDASDDESGERDSIAADTSDADSDDSDEDQDAEGDDGDDSQDAEADDRLQGQLAAAKKQADVSQKESRNFQRKFDQQTALMNEMMNNIKKLESGQNGNGNSADQPKSPMDNLDDEELVTGGQVKEALAAEAAHKSREDANRQLQAMTKRNNAMVNEKENVEEVLDFYEDQGLAKSPEQALMTPLGNFYRAESLLLKQKIEALEKKANNNQSKSGPKRKKARKKAQPPPIESGSGHRIARSGGGSSIADAMARKWERLGQ